MKSLAQKQLAMLVSQHPTQREAARWLRISPAYLNDLLHGRRDIPDGLALKLGVERVERLSRPTEPPS